MTSTLATVATAGLLAATALRALAWEPPADAQKTLAGGRPWSEVLADGRGAGLIHAAIDIAAPPSAVWSALTRCGATPLAASMKSCRILSGDQRAGWDVRERITRGSLFTPSIRDVVYTQYTPPLSIRFHRIGGDLKAEEGETRLEPLNGGVATRLIYVNRIAVISILPDAILRAAMRHATPEVLINLRRNSLAAVGPGPFASLPMRERKVQNP